MIVKAAKRLRYLATRDGTAHERSCMLTLGEEQTRFVDYFAAENSTFVSKSTLDIEILLRLVILS